MASSLWFAAMSFGTVLAFVPAATAQSVPPSRGFLEKTSTTSGPPVIEKRELTPEMRGDIFMAEKRYREAAEMYKEFAKGSAVLLNKTGIAYHQMLDLNLAERYYKLAIKANHNYAEAVNNLGTIYYTKKDFRRAVKEYKRALRINPQSASVWSNLALGYFSRKDYPKASEAFQTALKLDPSVFESRSSQGILLQERSVEERAKFDFYLAQTYGKAGQYDLAMQHIRKALEEGFKDKKKLEDDPAFAGMRKLPEFQDLMALQPRVL